MFVQSYEVAQDLNLKTIIKPLLTTEMAQFNTSAV